MMRQTTYGDDNSYEATRTHSASLGTAPTGFHSLWSNVSSICETILSWDTSPDFSGQHALQQLLHAYTLVYSLVSSPFSDSPALVITSGSQHNVFRNNAESIQTLVVYHRLCEMIRIRLSNVVEIRLREAASAPHPFLLETYIKEWGRFITAVNMLRSVFSYLHGPWQKYGLPSDHNMLPTEVVALSSWGSMISKTELGEALTKQVFILVGKDRLKRLTDKEARVLQGVGCALTLLADSRSNLYTTLIEERHLSLLSEYCKNKVTRMKEESPESYVKEALNIFIDEVERANRLLMGSSVQPVVQRISEVIIDGELEFLDDFIYVSIIESKHSQLRQLHTLLSKSENGLKRLKDKFRNCVAKEGLRRIDLACKEVGRCAGDVYRAALKTVISVYRYFTVPMDAFGGDTSFERELIEGLQSVLSASSELDVHTRLGQEVARFAHNKLNLLNPGEGCEENTNDINDIVILFRVLSVKTSFVEAYPLYFSRRLMSDTYHVESEKLLMHKIVSTKECSNDFIHKCETMLNDVTESSESLLRRFREEAEDTLMELEDFEFIPKVLSSYTWPVFSPDPLLTIPAALQVKLCNFQAFYSQACPKRHITYVNRLSHGILRLNLPCGAPVPNLNLHVGLRHLPIAELFNHRTEWDLEELLRAIKTDNTAIYVQAINEFSKHGILEVHDDEGGEVKGLWDVLPRHRVSLGRSPDTRKRKLVLLELEYEREPKLGAAAAGEFTSDHLDHSHSVADQMISLSTQAMLIRIFKVQGTASFMQLLEKTGELSPPHLKPTPQQIKAALEFLISRDYVFRDAEDGDTFVYIV
uniref:WGS project CAEQ00000000 data, annotated contig 881 n=1 Tax=Trypanosoma congolense (strain IL3000) TaxID=1068625 RepID=F9WJ74_TRYCI|nr:unnamed protein product [Trypanosoma congolense IL3000]